MARYFAYSLQFPNAFPYDKAEYRWATFVGEFIRPISEQNPRLLYWTSYYINTSEFKMYADDASEIQTQLDSFQQHGFVITPLQRSLEEDLGGGRFLGPQSASTATRRATLILHSLKCVCDLLVDSIYKRNDGYWTFEENADKLQNPIGNHLFSVTHLYHNITASQCRVYPFRESPENSLGMIRFFCSTPFLVVSGSRAGPRERMMNVLTEEV
ncbi:MAG: hypothetical protein ACLQU5_13145, partial [Isosphaeraceae bacterium]